MNEKQVVCNQNARFIFDFFEKGKWLPGEEAPLKNIIGINKATPESVRNLNEFISHRLSRIALMIEVLQSTHDNWTITGKKDRIIMETETFDFNDALAVLKSKGFNDDEYVLKVEYERRWGTL